MNQLMYLVNVPTIRSFFSQNRRSLSIHKWKTSKNQPHLEEAANQAMVEAANPEVQALAAMCWQQTWNKPHSQVRFFGARHVLHVPSCCTRKAAKSTELAGCFGAFCTLKTATKKWVDLRSSQQTWPSQFKICKINLSWRSPGRLPHPRFGLLGSLKLLNAPPTIQVPLLPAQMLPAMGPSWWSTWISIFHIFQLQSDLKDNKCWTMDTWKNLKEGSQHLRRPANLGTLMNSYTWKQSNLLNSDNPGFGAARSNTNLGSPSYIACPWPGRRCLWKWLAANPRNEAANRARPKRQNAGKAVGLDQNPKLSLVPSPLRTSERLNHANICKLCYSSGLKECKQWGRVSQRMYAEATTLHCWNCERSLPAKSLQ